MARLHSARENGFSHRSDCRLCNSTDLVRVLELSPTPPANEFVTKSAVGRAQTLYPLDVWFCRACAHLQLLDVVDPAKLFEKYVYVSGTSPVFVEHFRDYAATISARFALERNALVVDIGSNDGTLLRFFQKQKLRTIGIDPARDIAQKASESGVETIVDYFSLTLADGIRMRHGLARVVTANNVFAHIDDLASIVDGIRSLLDDRGVFVFEVSYLLDVFKKTLFDTIYHEHLDYHSVQPLVPFFERHGMQLIEVDRIDTHGGSLRGIAQLAGGPWAPDGSVGVLSTLEREAGLDREETFLAFAERIDRIGCDLRDLITSLKRKGKRIAGFGAPAKATTLMHHFDIGPNQIDFIVDDSPLKQGLYTPGLHVPVLPPTAIEERAPDYLLILSWNFAAPIMAKHQNFSNAGGRFIVPLPKLEIY